MPSSDATLPPSDALFPPLPLDAWEPTKHTLHLSLQVVGKLRMALTPKRNHWWHVPLYVGARGLTTGAMPTAAPVCERTVEIAFDVIDHRLKVQCSDGQTEAFALRDGLSVQQFYRQVFDALDALGVDADIAPEPFDHPDSMTPFPDDTTHDAYDAEAVHRYWRILSRIEPIFQTFRGRFVGKASPVHLFWHSFDLAHTRFSGEAAPAMPEADGVTQEAYSHEVVSFGFWAGDASTREPAFYAYASPEPMGLADAPLQPGAARWQVQESGALALLTYDDARTSAKPADAILAFLESAYQAGAAKAGWDVEALRNDAVAS